MASNRPEETSLRMKCSFNLFWVKVGSLNILENHIFYAGLQHKSQREEDLEFQIKTETDSVFKVSFLLFHRDQMVMLYFAWAAVSKHYSKYVRWLECVCISNVSLN